VLLVIGVCVAPTAHAQEKRAWGSGGVRVATQDLQAVSASLHSSLDRTGTNDEALRAAIDQFTLEADALLEAVERGKTRNEVWPLYKRLRESRLALAEKADLSGVTLSQAEVDEFQAVFHELETYFRQ
jgi:hypothetical protein